MANSALVRRAPGVSDGLVFLTDVEAVVCHTCGISDAEFLVRRTFVGRRLVQHHDANGGHAGRGAKWAHGRQWSIIRCDERRGRGHREASGQAHTKTFSENHYYFQVHYLSSERTLCHERRLRNAYNRENPKENPDHNVTRRRK